MLTVAEVNYIRYEVNQKDESYASVSRKTGFDARTVKKYANQEDFEVKKPQCRKAPVMDPVKPILDEWLNEDSKKKRKYRRTAKRLFQQLVDDHDFKGSERSVRQYVSKRKKELKTMVDQAALPLESIPGTAQVDFGTAPFVYQSESMELPYLVMSFPFSNTFYFQVFPSENAECLLEGLQRMFHHMGGVPRTIRFDNFRPAVKKILGKGERKLTDVFERFVGHYGFHYEFCNPGKGNEKGHVEAMVKYVRNNFLLPECHIEDLDQFNETLWQKAEDDRDRSHYKKDVPIDTLYQEDCAQWLLLPEKSFDCVRYEVVKADKYGFITVDKKQYSSSPRFAGDKLTVAITYHSVSVLNEQHEAVVHHSRLYGVRRKSMVWQPYLDLLSRRPRAIKYTSIYDHFPEEWTRYLKACTEDEQKEALRLLGTLLKNDDFTVLNQALNDVSAQGHPSVDQIKHRFYSLVNNQEDYSTYTPQMSLPDMPDITRGLDHYDALYAKEGGARE